ncbi:DoxX family protein [Candidatus Woesearchaeota archaeon]|nr:MAG: DoxX family protein [Candidatus Woesearchaeota archaeon]
MEKCKQYGPLVLRLMLGVAFVVAALDKILSLPMARGMFEGLFGASLGAPLLYLAIAVELAGGLMLIFGWHTMEAAAALAVLILVAFFATFKLGAAPNLIATLREVMVMNTGGGNTAVNWAYFAGLLALVFNGCAQCEAKTGKRR